MTSWPSRSRCSSAPATCSRSSRRASSRARTAARSRSTPRRSRASAIEEMVAPPARGRPTIVGKDPNVDGFSNNVGFGPGGGGGNQGRMHVDLKPRGRAHADASTRSSRSCGRSCSRCPGIRVYLTNPPPINIGGQQTRAACTSSRCRTPTPAELYHYAPLLEDKMRQLPGLAGRQQRPAGQEPAGQRRPRPRQDLGARPDGRRRSRRRSTTRTARGRSRRSTRRTTSTR